MSSFSSCKKGNRRKYPISSLFPLSSLKFIISDKKRKGIGKQQQNENTNFFVVSNLKALTAENINSKTLNEYKSTRKR